LGNFTSRWHKKPEISGGVGTKIKDGLKSSDPIRPKLDQASRQIQIQAAKVEQAQARLKERDVAIFSKVVSAIQKNDNARANMLANELSEIRRMGLVLTQAKLALEQLVLRLSTVTDLGDITATLAPAMNIIKGVKPGLVNLIPDAEHEIGEISTLLSGILIEAGQIGPNVPTFEASSEDAERVLEEASLIARNGMNQKFPDVPETQDDQFEAET
jgi:division protein CdvB (Snf7/Vps24/ESCRT-III family)